MSRLRLLAVFIWPAVASSLLLCCAAAASVKVHVSLSARHPISPHVYGVNFATQTMLDWGIGANRQSGDASSMYNWKLDITNSANDGFWRTAAPYRPYQPPTPANSSFIDGMMTRTAAAGSVFVQPLQAVGWVTKSRDDCFSFPVSVYGPQQRHQGDAGDGVLENGTELAGDWRCYRPYGIGDNAEWLSHMEQVVGRQRLQSQLWLQTADNEPDCFNPVHRDAHPLMFGYDEMWATIAGFGAVVKAAYPLLQLNGPSWSNYCWWYWVRGDGCGGTDGLDFRQHGGQYSTAWLMQRMDEYYVATGIRLLDSIDFHHYPMYPVEVPNRDDSEEEQQAILDSVRTLWDWTFVTPGSDLARCGERCLGPAAAILPRMVGEVRRYTPNMQLKFTLSEYAFGFNDSCYTGALAVAEALALFGYWDVFMSGRWLSPAEGSRVEQAFKLFLNYDGRGGSIRGDSAATTSWASPNHTAYTVYEPQLQTLYSLLFNRQLDSQGSSRLQRARGRRQAGRRAAAAERHGVQHDACSLAAQSQRPDHRQPEQRRRRSQLQRHRAASQSVAGRRAVRAARRRRAERAAVAAGHGAVTGGAACQTARCRGQRRPTDGRGQARLLASRPQQQEARRGEAGSASSRSSHHSSAAKKLKCQLARWLR